MTLKTWLWLFIYMMAFLCSFTAQLCELQWVCINKSDFWPWTRLEPAGKQGLGGKGEVEGASCYEAYKFRDAEWGQKASKEVVEEPLEILKDKTIFWTKVIFTLSQSYEGHCDFLWEIYQRNGSKLGKLYNLGDYDTWECPFLRIKFDLGYHHEMQMSCC